MKNLNLYALANELNLGEAKSGTIRVPFGRWDFGAKKLDDGRNVFFVQELAKDGAERMAAKINAGVADGEKGVPVYWGHPDVPELAHKYPDKRAKGWIKSAAVEADALILNVEWLEENATDGFGWFSPYWGGPAADLGQGRYLKRLDSLTSVALVNIPNIQEFRLANELQGGLNDNERTFAMPQHLIDLARRYDERVRLANEWDESKHPREEDGTFAPAGTATGIYSVDNWNKQFAEHRSNRSFWRKTEGPNEVLERLRHHTVSYRSRAAELRKSGSRGDKYMNGKFEADYLAQDRINNRESIVRVHKAAILAGYTYNPKTHQYE